MTRHILSTSLVLLILASAAHATVPVVTNVVATQRTDTKLVDIYYDVFDDDDLRLLVQSETAPESHRSILTLRKDHGQPQCLGHHKTDHDAAQRGRNNPVCAKPAQSSRESRADLGGYRWIFEQSRTLHVCVAVKPGRQPEVARMDSSCGL